MVVFTNVPSLLAQSRYQLKGEQELAVLGSSTIHNREMVTQVAEGNGLFWFEGDSLHKVEALAISFEAASLESGKGRIMDRNARRALKVEEHPLIAFKLNRTEVDDTGQYWAYGNLTAAGVTKELTFKIDITKKGEALEVRAKTSFKLTDFEIKPPVALAGTLKTGNAVSLDVWLSFERITK